jgi:septal ring factor EnvC (AmiA/AmiB activator)
MAQLEELQEWEEDRVNVLQQHQQQMEELEAREEEYAIQIQQLQNDIDELVTERAAQYDEYDTLQTNHQTLIKKIEKADNELQRVMDDLEKLNAENTEYAERIEAFKNASIDNEDSKVKFR